MVHQIYRFWPWNKTRRAAITAKRTKIAVTTRKETVAIVKTIPTTEKRIAAKIGTAATREIAAVIKTAAIIETAVAVETMAIAARALKIFRKKAIIAAGKKTANMVAKASKKR